MLPHRFVNTHSTQQEWRHTRAERSRRYRKCALLPIHDSQLTFTIHNSQFTICLKCLLGGSCQTQTKLIYARHRQTNRETNSHTDRQTDRRPGRQAGRETTRQPERQRTPWLGRAKEVGPILAFAFKRAVFVALLTPQQLCLLLFLDPSSVSTLPPWQSKQLANCLHESVRCWSLRLRN